MSITVTRPVRRCLSALAAGCSIVALIGAGDAPSPVPEATAIASSSPAPAVTSANDALLRRVIALSTSLNTYHATIHADVAFHSFPFITTHLDGDVYFKKPDRQAVVFDTVPLLAGSIKKFYPNVPSPSRWETIYTLTSLGDSAGATTYRLVPKKHGRVEHLDVKVDDAKATVESYTWTYEDGGDITFDQTFVMTGGHLVVATQVGKVELPSYKADVTSAISNYRLNVPVDDAVFAESK